MAKKRLRVGVIGCGGIAQGCHWPNWKELADEGRVELIGACDNVKERAQKAADEFGVKRAFNSYSSMLKAEEFDIVDVCTQNRLHKPITVAALKAGAHVIVEKPMAMNVRECKEMIAAAKAGKRKLMVAQHMRFEAANERFKEVAASGALGQVYHANTHWIRRRGIPAWGRFHIKKESCGGPLIDLGVHVMDLAVWLMGSPKPVAASGKTWCMFGDRDDLVNGSWGRGYPASEYDVEDYAAAFVRFEDNITMSMEVSWAANIGQERHGFYILGDKSGIGTYPQGVYGYRQGALTTTNFDWLPKQEGHRMEIRHFTECVEKNLPVRVQPEESLNIQKIIDAIYESSKRNREVLIK